MCTINKLINNPPLFQSMLTNIRKHHPLFMKLTFRGAKIILKQGNILRLDPLQILFKDGSMDTTLFIMLYGKVVLRTIDDGIVGVVGIGESIGEETILMPNYQYRQFIYNK